MPSYSFTKSPDSELYLYSDTGTPVTGKPYTVGFLLPTGTTSFPATLTLAQSWAEAHGLYLFFQETPADQAAFVAAVRAYLAAGGLDGTRFLWIGGSAEIPALWSIADIAVAGSSPASLSRFAEIGLQNYRLCLDAGLAVTLSDPAQGSAYPAFVVAGGQAGQVRLDTGSGDPPLTGIGATVEIAMSGAQIGCVRFQLTIAKSTTSGPGTEMGALQSGMSFFYPDPQWGPAFLSSLTYPVLSPASAALVFYPALDPLNPLDPARTLFALVPPNGGASVQLAGYYRTWVGRNVGLTPAVGTQAGFAMSPRPRFPGDESPPYVLTPNGSFTIVIPALAHASPVAGESDSATRIMCGLSAVEYVGYLPPLSGTVANTLTFYPGNPAYAASFDPGSESAAASGLSGEAATSYLAFTPNGPAAMNYYSQPDASVFYDPSSFAPPADPNFLDMKEIIVNQLASGAAAAMPMVPLAGLDGTLAAQALHARFEVKVVSQARRDLINAGLGDGVAAATPVAATATTRNGMLGSFGAPTQNEVPLVKIQLAQSGGSTDTLVLAGSGGGDVTGPLKQALLSNQLFLVISNDALFSEQGTFLSAVLEIAAIPFDLDPSYWSKNGTILVYKYAGASIANLAADLGSWSFPQDFTDGALTQANLLSIIEGIRVKIEVPPETAPDPDFLHVYEAVTDPAWNGILAFNVEVSLDAMPSQLAGIAAGIDPAQFRAHHLGINMSPMDVVSGVLTMRDTALFGLIDYVDAAPFAAAGTAGYAFKVSVLKILFGNSEIRDFACTIELLLQSLFGSTVALVDGSGAVAPESVIALDGYYQHAPAGDTFSFTSRSDLHFKAASAALDEVEITGADFVTLNPDAPAGEDGTKALRTQFVFAGNIRFHDVPDFDALSFGDLEGSVPLPGGLAYSNLVIHMDYELTSAGVTQNSVFAFDAQNMAVDIAASVARPQSLFAHFPLKFKGFVQGQSGSTPEGLGYLAAATPITEAPVTYPWYGLQYELNLGTFGALASNAGFAAGVLIGWSSAPGVSVYTGVRIPGASPQNLSFSIEGLLGLSIDDIRFTAAPSSEGSMAYTLVFTNLALRFLGLKIPQSAYVDLVLFGNPDPSKSAASLGWYASYQAA